MHWQIENYSVPTFRPLEMESSLGFFSIISRETIDHSVKLLDIIVSWFFQGIQIFTCIFIISSIYECLHSIYWYYYDNDVLMREHHSSWLHNVSINIMLSILGGTLYICLFRCTTLDLTPSQGVESYTYVNLNEFN